MKAKITLENIANLDDKDIDELIFEKGSEKNYRTIKDYLDDNEKNKAMYEMYSMRMFEGDVCNGGFDQFFLNYEELFFPAINGLQKINAPKHLSLLQRAYDIHESQKKEFTDKRNVNLDELDDEFYELEDLAPFRQKFIKENINLFLD
ncbi:MAG: DUF4375 domain-containing protein [Arcicella sp.]|nr:DUF4375 domain-containing protein [Arcicella sp.]